MLAQFPDRTVGLPLGPAATTGRRGSLAAAAARGCSAEVAAALDLGRRSGTDAGAGDGWDSPVLLDRSRQLSRRAGVATLEGSSVRTAGERPWSSLRDDVGGV